jgi:hypothetical protein
MMDRARHSNDYPLQRSRRFVAHKRHHDFASLPVFLTWIKFKVLAYKLRLQMPAQE